MQDVSRRGFLAGLFGTAVIVAVPQVAQVVETAAIEPIDPWAIQAPSGTTYQWVRTALLGVPDPENVQRRLDNGWEFVPPTAHLGAPTSTVEHAIEMCGLVLMKKPTQAVQETLAAERLRQDARTPSIHSRIKPSDELLSQTGGRHNCE